MRVEYLHRLSPTNDCGSLCGFRHPGILRYCTQFAPGKKPEVTGSWDILEPCPECEKVAAQQGLEPRRPMTKADCMGAGGVELLLKCMEMPEVATVAMIQGGEAMLAEAKKMKANP